MALDSLMISSIAYELNQRLAGGRVDKIHQPEKDELNLYIRAGKETEKLLLSASSGTPRVCITEKIKDNPQVPLQFCTLLRKYISGAKVIRVYQPEFERIIIVELEARDEMGFPSVKNLICELMGRFGNLIFTDESMKILGVLKPVDMTESALRQLLPGMIYELPPKQEKLNTLSVTRCDFMRAMSGQVSTNTDKLIVRLFSGISPLVAREIVFRTTGETDTDSDSVDKEKLFVEFSSVISRVRENDYSPSAVFIDGKPTEYSFMPIYQYGKSNMREYSSASRLIDEFYYEKDRVERIHQRAQDIFKILQNAEHRLQKKISLQEKELEDCLEKEKYKRFGDLITANLYLLKKPVSEVTLVDYYSPDMEEVTVKLDPLLSPSANAQSYYKKYNKMKKAEVELTKQIAIAKKELEYIYTVFDALERASTRAELDEIRRELEGSGYASKNKKKEMQSRKAQKPKLVRYRTTNGYLVLCGANNLQNDYLTFEVAEKNDYWFHVKNAPGSHAVLFCAGMDEPPAEDFTDAAIIAATNSKLKTGEKVTVDYTLVKNVKKPPASKPGYVTYATNYSAYVTPNEAYTESLRSDN